MPLSHPRRSALSEQVIAALRAQITSGEWPVGSRIPTEPELVEQLGVARNTVREAVRALSHNGLLDIRQGSGTYVVATSELAGVMQRRFAGADPGTSPSCGPRWSRPRPGWPPSGVRRRTSSSSTRCCCGVRRPGSRVTRRRS
ncbi:putative Exu regulon transcriptional regulator [Streptomyces afghaniensis 772]|uniref:Putative Exu regulon transcriptional regulator n=1 Tax=Streptomyces afghaniensis 772 TaxID=1283301 RepID=S4MQ70_9ACTN|nr:putative Exu regulon transcriptional regulator [Streptomyces afghaniensis 772]